MTIPKRLAAPTPDRNSVTTIRSDGSRDFLFPRDPEGRFTQARRVCALALVAFYLSLPWITLNGFPAVFLDVAQRRFHLFGLTLAAQDMWLLFFLITGLGFSLFFVTALLGRVWCGWACPQTVFLDHVYRRVERWIDGDAVQRRILATEPLSAKKISKRVAKHTIYLLLSAVITHLFLAYFVSIADVWAMITAAPAEHWSAFAFIVVATGILYFNFAWFREQLCIVICPYGRIQSALIDDHSLVVGYDAERGEPRGRIGLPDTGDCIACNRCVQVCPTGIDIRQGLQMECIGCTACIDACDDVMTRVEKPRGLIRYDSQNGFAGRKTEWIRPRTILYFGLLAVGAGVCAWALSTVKPASLSITRMMGAPYVVDRETVRNQFLVRIVNKRSESRLFSLKVAAPAGTTHVGFEDTVLIAGMDERVQPLVVQQPRGGYSGPFRFEVRIEDTQGRRPLIREMEFLGPDPGLLREDEKQKNGPR